MPAGVGVGVCPEISTVGVGVGVDTGDPVGVGTEATEGTTGMEKGVGVEVGDVGVTIGVGVGAEEHGITLPKKLLRIIVDCQ